MKILLIPFLVISLFGDSKTEKALREQVSQQTEIIRTLREGVSSASSVTVSAGVAAKAAANAAATLATSRHQVDTASFERGIAESQRAAALAERAVILGQQNSQYLQSSGTEVKQHTDMIVQLQQNQIMFTRLGVILACMLVVQFYLIVNMFRRRSDK